MREVLLTSSVLILALLLLRRVFRKKISRRVQYALWALVLVRLLAPVSLPALDFSVLTMAEPVQETISARLEAPAFTAPVVPIPNIQNQQPQSPYPEAKEPSASGTASAVRPADEPAEPAAKQLTVTEILGIVWLAGAAAMTVWLIASNLSFAAKLRRSRVDVGRLSGVDRNVYMVESGLASPCLFGVVKPAIYLTPSAAQSEASLRHVLAHEETHARHLDPLWALLRSVCLAIYWFDPLVWIAASASKTDCELACDEGAIRRLGEEERLAYGKTLLSLIPIRRLPGNPLLSATTMSSDKKRLRDRVTRIAENRKTRKLALCAMAVLLAATCIFTFAGCVEKKTPDAPPAAPAEPDTPDTEEQDAAAAPPVAVKQDGPLTAAELQYFNERFFNGDYLNICNQFLSSTYEDVADVDLFELFYCGSGQGSSASDEERAAYEAEDGFVDCDITRVSTGEADKVLLTYAGLTLEQTNKTGLENFTYLPEFDAYFFGHGDTNYRYQVDITDGVREGDLLRLYYNDTFYADGWKCVTLRERGNGGYHFVSNTACEKPVIPTAYPAGEPLLTIPLAEGRSRGPEKLANNQRLRWDCREVLTDPGKSTMVDDRSIICYRSGDKSYYVAEVLDSNPDSWKARLITFAYKDDAFSIDCFEDVLGWKGVVVSYSKDVDDTYHAYYGVDENGDWHDLFYVPGYGMDCRSIDLDGDGVTELLCTDSALSARLYFQKDGKIYNEDIAELLKEAWPEAGEYIEFNAIRPYARSLSCWALGTAAKEDGTEFDAMMFRNLYFDGENLLVYKPDKTAVDHVVPGVSAPEYVMKAARDFVEQAYVQTETDDWRILSLAGPWYEPFDDFTVEVYRVNYEHHSTAPENVVWAGGTYVDEDGWVSPGYPDCDYLYFRVNENGSRTYLFSIMENDCAPDGELFREDLERTLVQSGTLEQTPAQEVQWALDEIMSHSDMDLKLDRPVGGRMDTASFTVSPETGNARNRQNYFTDPGTFTWTKEGTEPLAGDPAPDAEELTVSSMSSSISLTFFSGSERVLCRNGDSRQWYRAENMQDPADVFYNRSDIFNFMREIFDEAEWYAMCAAISAIPDDGRSREEITREWVEAYEGVHLNATDGGHTKWTYMDIRDIAIDEERPKELMPEYPGAQDVFLFNYSAVFVPEGDPNWFIAGNTADYEGDDAPEGALQWWRCGYMYLLEDGWHCDGVGTGP